MTERPEILKVDVQLRLQSKYQISYTTPLATLPIFLFGPPTNLAGWLLSDTSIKQELNLSI
jgi:hypothetical protein